MKTNLKRQLVALDYFDDPDFVNEIAEMGYKLVCYQQQGNEEKAEETKKNLICLLYSIVESA